MIFDAEHVAGLQCLHLLDGGLYAIDAQLNGFAERGGDAAFEGIHLNTVELHTLKQRHAVV